jgi:hypothetical protein
VYFRFIRYVPEAQEPPLILSGLGNLHIGKIF